MNKNIGGLIGGILLVGILWLFMLSNRNSMGYGMAILPAIIISVPLFILGFLIGKLICKNV